MTNLERLDMEIQGISLTDSEKTIYLLEQSLNAIVEYDPQSKSQLKAIYKTALAILEGIANNPTMMKNYKQDDISVIGFAEALEQRIDHLQRKIRTMPDDDAVYQDGASIIYLFNK